MTRTAAPPTVLRTIPGPESCEMCGTPGLKTELVRDPFIYGAGADAVKLSAEVPVHTCSSCAVSFTGEDALIARHEAVCRHLGVLTPGEIRELRTSNGMSRAAFARLTGFGEATLARWERREVIQNVSSDRYLRLLQDPSILRRLSLIAEAPHDPETESSLGVRRAVALVMLPPPVQNRFRRRGESWNLRRGAA